MKLSDLQYSVLIQALHNAKDSHFEGEFIDPYAEYAGKHTQEDVEQAINEVETIVMQSWAIKRAKELMETPDAIFETDEQKYMAWNVTAIQHNSTTREKAEENEVIYSNFND